MTINIVVANFIWFIHVLFISFIILAPFSKSIYILLIHIIISIGVLTHWYTNSNICSLSLFESKLRNINYNETFMHRLVSPIYNISESELLKFCYLVVILALLQSIFNVYNSPNTYKMIKCFKINKYNHNKCLKFIV